MRALLSIITLYKYKPDLFDLLHIPKQLDREALVDELCMTIGELNLIITDPDVLKLAIDRWSRTRVDVWQHLYDTTQYKYNPIWNKDGVYKETEKAKSNSTGNLTGTDYDDTSAYNSTTYQNAERTRMNHDSKNNAEAEVVREREEHGNIGVTTTQQMIKEEREIAEFSLYKMIIEEFMHRFCIMVY